MFIDLDGFLAVKAEHMSSLFTSESQFFVCSGYLFHPTKISDTNGGFETCALFLCRIPNFQELFFGFRENITTLFGGNLRVPPPPNAKKEGLVKGIINLTIIP